MTVRAARDAAEVKDAQDLRVRVFCDEQGVSPDQELDSRDAEATQIVAVDQSGVIATCRLRLLDGEAKLERMAVEQRLRNLGVGAKLLEGAEQEARTEGAGVIVLHAQLRAEGFYASHGYVPEGDTFMEAGIEHVRMRKAL